MSRGAGRPDCRTSATSSHRIATAGHDPDDLTLLVPHHISQVNCAKQLCISVLSDIFKMLFHVTKLRLLEIRQEQRLLLYLYRDYFFFHFGFRSSNYWFLWGQKS